MNVHRWISWMPERLRDRAKAVLDRMCELYWGLVFRFRPTHLVDPSMRPVFAEYLRLHRRLIRIEHDDSAEAEGLRGRMDPLWHRLNDAERKTLDAGGAMPYPDVQEAIDGLPPQGGTVVSGPGIQVISMPIVITRNHVRIIGGHFRSFGADCIQMMGVRRIWMIDCFFEVATTGPKDWSPRGDMNRKGFVMFGGNKFVMDP